MSLVIGLTGGIASGKSTVSTMFKKLDITVVDADIEAHRAVMKGESAYVKLLLNLVRLYYWIMRKLTGKD